MDTKPTIELPRLENERAERYQARVEYITAGADRSLRDLARKLNKSLTIVGRWSAEDDWPRLAADYDQTVYTLAANDASNRYRADLEAHRKKASDAGRSLYTVASQLIIQINTALANPKKIKGDDGKWYTLHGLDLTANTFSIAARAMQTALDLEAHALGIDKLLPSLGDADDS